MENDIDILARTIFGEARNQSHEGMVAVANVVLNRAYSDKWFGGTISKVCQRPYQFSCWNENDPNCKIIKAVTEKDPVFTKCLEIAKDAVDEILEDNTSGACFYKVAGVYAKWSEGHTPCVVIGSHEFFNDVD